MNKNDFITVLAYIKFYPSDINSFDQMLIHQHINQGIKLSPVLKAKINRIHNVIIQISWEAPEKRFNSARELEIYDREFEQWVSFSQYKDSLDKREAQAS